ncbi:MAG: ArsR family transcriptional regulator [Bacteroidetes bacterium]|nr:MAG: ArsR family transcriptional regulator [Bacteroidota bacterium]
MKLDTLLHQELRLAIVSFLANDIEWASFNALIEVTESTKGNLSVQLKKLEAADYIKIKKRFKNNYPLTECRLTETGKEALQNYIQELRKMLNI